MYRWIAGFNMEIIIDEAGIAQGAIVQFIRCWWSAEPHTPCPSSDLVWFWQINYERIVRSALDENLIYGRNSGAPGATFLGFLNCLTHEDCLWIPALRSWWFSATASSWVHNLFFGLFFCIVRSVEPIARSKWSALVNREWGHRVTCDMRLVCCFTAHLL